MIFAGEVYRLPPLHDRQARPQQVDTIDMSLKMLWAKFANDEISEDIAQRADEILRAKRADVVVPMPRRWPGAFGWGAAGPPQ